MSVEAITWAFKQPIKHSPAKFVLVVLANQANGDLAYPSIAYIAGVTGQDRKTVISNLQRLRATGLIVDSGERRGRTAQVVVYRLKCEPDLFERAARAGPKPKHKAANSTKTGTVGSNDTEIGTGTKTGTVGNGNAIANNALACNGPNSGTGTESGTRNQELEARSRAKAKPLSPCAPAPEAGNGDFGPVTFHASPVSEASRAMIEAGIPAARINHSHPALGEALAAGVTPQELADVTREYLTRGQGPPPMVYVLRTATGRRNDVQSRQREPENGTRVRRSQPNSRPSAVDKVANFIRERRAREAAARPGDDDDESVVASG